MSTRGKAIAPQALPGLTARAEGLRADIGLAFALLLLAAAIFGPTSAVAQASTVEGFFNSMAEGSLSQRLVVAINESMTTALVSGLLAKISALFQAVISACCLLAIILSGWRVTTGQMHEPKSELALTVIKVAMVAYFARTIGIDGPDNLIVKLLEVPNDLVAMVSETLPDSLFVQGCTIEVYNGDPSYRIWRDLDCLLVSFMALTALGSTVSALLGFLVSNLFSGYVGIHIMVLGIASLSGMVFSILRASYIYVSSMISIVFILSLAPIFLPCLLFQATRQYFDKWMGMCIGYILQPMLVVAYLVIMLSLYQAVLFTNENSVAAALTGAPMTSPVQFQSTLSGLMKGVIHEDIVASAGQMAVPQNAEGVVDAADPTNIEAFKAAGHDDYPLAYCDAEGEAGRSERCQDPFGGLANTWIYATADTIDYCEYVRRLGKLTASCGTPEADRIIGEQMGKVVMSLTVFMLVVFANFSLLQLLEQIVKRLSAISARVSIPFTMSIERTFNRALYGADFYAFAGQSGGFLGEATRNSSWAPAAVTNPELGALPAYRAGLSGALNGANLPFGIGSAAISWLEKAEMDGVSQLATTAMQSGNVQQMQQALTQLQSIVASSPNNRAAQTLLAQLERALGAGGGPS